MKSRDMARIPPASVLAAQGDALTNLVRAKQAHARQTPQHACRNRNDIAVSAHRSRLATETERSNATLFTNSGAREAQHARAQARGKRQQPHARNQNEREV